jgi:hypothetical protein
VPDVDRHRDVLETKGPRANPKLHVCRRTAVAVLSVAPLA